MANGLIPRSFYSPMSDMSVFDDLLDTPSLMNNNVAVSEDDKHIYIQAAVPGVNPDDIEITFDKGMVWIHGETNEEEKGKNKKYYQKATNAFSYRLMVPGDIDTNVDPEASCDNGVVTVTFAKAAKAQPKKISVKTSGKKTK